MPLQATLPAAMCLTALLATPALAADRRVTIVNTTGFTIMEFYGSSIWSNSWEEDIFGTDVLPTDDDMRVNFDDGSGHCIYDFRAVFDDGDEIISHSIDICVIDRFTYD